MDVQEVEITIDEKGNVQLQVRGVKGSACLDLTAGLEAMLGGQVELREMTSEASEAERPIDKERRLRGGSQ